MDSFNGNGKFRAEQQVLAKNAVDHSEVNPPVWLESLLEEYAATSPNSGCFGNLVPSERDATASSSGNAKSLTHPDQSQRLNPQMQSSASPNFGNQTSLAVAIMKSQKPSLFGTTSTSPTPFRFPTPSNPSKPHMIDTRISSRPLGLFDRPDDSQSSGLFGISRNSQTISPSVDHGLGQSISIDLTGPRALQNVISKQGKTLGLVSGSVPCIQEQSAMPLSPKKSAERRSKLSPSTIGYLGELFIVSFLRGLLSDSPCFDPSINWTSKLRRRAKYCHSYREIAAYKQLEVSDITFCDEDGSFSTWLHGQGYKVAQAWVDRPVTYYIEVKTTISNARTPFIMTSDQMKHAERWTYEPESKSPQKSISCYLIFRVYRILDDCRNMCIYADPYKLMQDGVLERQTRQYYVTPGRTNKKQGVPGVREDTKSDEGDERVTGSILEHDKEAADSSGEEWYTDNDDDDDDEDDDDDGDDDYQPPSESEDDEPGSSEEDDGVDDIISRLTSVASFGSSMSGWIE